MLLVQNLKTPKGDIRLDQFWTVPHLKLAADLAQGLQGLDVVFSILKWTRNSPIITFAQIGSRLVVIFLLFPVMVAPAAEEKSLKTLGVFLCLANWSLIEIVRYGYYFSKEAGIGFLSTIFGHFRYNVFIFAYVLGVGGELISIYAAYPDLEAMTPGTRPLEVLMPNKWNFVFDTLFFAKISPLMYLAGFP